MQTLQDNHMMVRASAVHVAARRVDFYLNLATLSQDSSRIVRRACAEEIRQLNAEDAVAILLQIALAHNGVHKEDVAALLARYDDHALTEFHDLVTCDNRYRRRLSLATLPRFLACRR